MYTIGNKMLLQYNKLKVNTTAIQLIKDSSSNFLNCSSQIKVAIVLYSMTLLTLVYGAKESMSSSQST